MRMVHITYIVSQCHPRSDKASCVDTDAFFHVPGSFTGMLTTAAASQADLAQKQLQQRALARGKEELGLPVRPKREARLPLQLSEAQLECYRDVLARRFDVLADPKRPRHSAQRTSEMRALCAELRKVIPRPAPPHIWSSARDTGNLISGNPNAGAGMSSAFLFSAHSRRVSRQGWRCQQGAVRLRWGAPGAGVHPPLPAAPHAARGGGGVRGGGRVHQVAAPGPPGAPDARAAPARPHPLAEPQGARPCRSGLHTTFQ